MVLGGGKAALRGKPVGEVWLVGAGPGDPDLLTIKALKVLQSADVVVHDGLVSDEILDLAPASARRISVAKRKSRHSYSQDEINRMLTAFALEGLTVVRLKGVITSSSAGAEKNWKPAAPQGALPSFRGSPRPSPQAPTRARR